MFKILVSLPSLSKIISCLVISLNNLNPLFVKIGVSKGRPL